MSTRNLTPEERDQVIAVRKEWMEKYGLNTQPAERSAAEAYIRQAYTEAGLNPPRHIIWVGSPYAGALALALVPQTIDAALEMVTEGVRKTMAGETVSSMTTKPLGFDRAAVDMWWRNASYGQHNADFYSYVDVAKQMGTEGLDNVDGVLGVAKTAGWWWPAEEFCIVTERPTQLHWNAAGDLHNAEGPAIAYPDGWGLYMWNGTRVPKSLVEGNWTIKQILEEPNLEIRRCAIEKLGWERLIIEGRFEMVGEPVQDPGNPGHELALFNIPRELGPEEEPTRILLCDNATPERDGTRRRFGITVPAGTPDALSAAAWTFGLSRDEYATLQRAC